MKFTPFLLYIVVFLVPFALLAQNPDRIGFEFGVTESDYIVTINRESDKTSAEALNFDASFVGTWDVKKWLSASLGTGLANRGISTEFQNSNLVYAALPAMVAVNVPNWRISPYLEGGLALHIMIHQSQSKVSLPRGVIDLTSKMEHWTLAYIAGGGFRINPFLQNSILEMGTRYYKDLEDSYALYSDSSNHRRIDWVRSIAMEWIYIKWSFELR